MGRPRGEKPASSQPQAPVSPRILPTVPLVLSPSHSHIILYLSKPPQQALVFHLFLVHVCPTGRWRFSPVYPLATVWSLPLSG